MIAFTGPVRQVETAPMKAVTMEPRRRRGDGVDRRLVARRREHREALPFCTTSTVIASGTTSSDIACQENAARRGWAARSEQRGGG
jgi:hypothetical protein